MEEGEEEDGVLEVEVEEDGENAINRPTFSDSSGGFL